MFTIQVNNQDFTQFTSANVNVSMDNFGRTLTLTCTQDQLNAFPIKIKEKVTIKIDGVSLLTGFIEKIAPTVSENDHTVGITGRSVAADLVDSTLNNITLNAPITMEDVVRTVITSLGLTLTVTTNVVGLEPFNATEIVKAKPAQNAFEFIEQYARKRQVILLDDGDGNIILANGSGITSPYGLILGQNILSSNTSYDYSDRFYKYIVLSQANPIGGQAIDADITAEPDLVKRQAIIKQKAEANEGDETTVATQGEAIDAEIRPTRILYLEAENPSDLAECTKRAQWELNVRKARSRSYNCSLQGHTFAQGVPVDYNKLHQIVDGVAGINDIMLVSQVDYSESTQGTGVALTMVDRNSYSLQNEKPVKQAKTSTEGDDFIGAS